MVNSTPLGTVLTRSQLRRHMDAAAGRVGDGKTIHFLRYVRWLIQDLWHPRRAPVDYAESRRRQAEKNLARTKAGQDVGPVPDVADMARRQRALAGVASFARTYFPQTFHWDWSPDHLRVIGRIEQAVREGGLFAFAMPRGSGKTSLAWVSALWAVLAGYCRYVVLIGGSVERGQRLLESVKTAILANADLAGDFPEAFHCLRALDNTAKRQYQQHVGGRLTHVRWEPDRIVLPRLATEALPPTLREAGLSAAPSAEAIIAASSLDAHIRGHHHLRPDGRTARPDMLLLDDPQTRASARSTAQTRFRMQLLTGDVLGLAGPDRPIAAVLTCTVIYQDDLASQVLDRSKHPEWQGERTELVHAWPTNKALLAQYAQVRADGLRAGLGMRPADRFWRANRAALEAGAKVAWAERFFRQRGEISAIQHAVNLQLAMGPEAFAAECQNAPVQEQLADEVVTPPAAAAKTNGRPRGQIPIAAGHVTGFVDVHDRLLYWCVCAWEQGFTGYVIDYGTFPAQGQAWFTMREARNPIAGAFPGRGEDGAILAALEALAAELLRREFPRAGRAGVARVERLLVDSGYKPALVAAVKHRLGGSTMDLSRGVGIGARNRPMAAYQRKPGERYGHHWYFPAVRGTREFPHVQLDVNYWKTFIHRGLATPLGEPGALSLFGREPRAHELFADHVAGSETWTWTHGHGREVQEWRPRASHPDNHWLDCLAGCAAAASMLGCATPGMDAQALPRRKRYTQADLSLARRRPGAPGAEKAP